MVILALYKGKGKPGNYLTRWWTRSIYSHCELVINGVGYSASFMDGGVRAKRIDFLSGRWDLIPLPWADKFGVLEFYERTEGRGYDWLGLFGAQLFNNRTHDPLRYFCNEWCGDALGIPHSMIYNPHTFGGLCQWLNGAPPMLSNVRKDPHDPRDYLHQPATAQSRPPRVDLRVWAGAIEDQRNTGSCTANATVSCGELILQRAGRFLDLSRLFLYYNTRAGTQFEGKDEGAYLRDAIKSLNKLGACAEARWPFDESRLHVKPSDECYTEAVNYRAGRYERIDATGDTWLVLLNKLRDTLAAGLPIIFSMPLGQRFLELGDIKTLEGMKYRYPTIKSNPRDNAPIGGHAMLLVGYDDSLDGFIVENSWGSQWGAGGYCLMPYTTLTDEYFDFWVLTEFAGIGEQAAPPTVRYLTIAEVLEAYRDIGREVAADDEGVLYWSTHATDKREIYQSAAQFLQPALKAYRLLNGAEYCE